MTNVTTLKALKAPKAAETPKAMGRKLARRMKHQRMAAVGLGLVATTLTGLSLSHLAHGISIVTGAPTWEAWSMAIGIDIGFVALELSQIVTTTDKLRNLVRRYTAPAILGTLAGSAVMNAFAFATQAHGAVMMSAAIVLGVAIPALIYAMTRIGAALYLDGSK